MPDIKMIHGDCMEIMKQYPDKYFQLACVDPPYGIDNGNMNLGFSQSSKLNKTEYDCSIPPMFYFKELERVSKNQIIWGMNYLPVPKGAGVIVWDKMEGMYNRSFSEVELAYTSIGNGRIIRISPNNQADSKIHKAQKPVALYKWLLSRYAKPGDRILDTHGGSGSICIACHDLGYDLTWMELDKDYYDAACERYRIHASQTQLFQPEPAPKPKESSLF